MSRPRNLAALAAAWAPLALAACAGPEPAPAEPVAAEVADAVTAAPDVYAVLHEDERGRVVEMKLAPGATDGLHRHPHEVVYFASGGALRVDLPDGEAMDAEVADGGVLSHGPWTHTVTNVGDTTVHGVIVELRGEPGGRAPVAEGRDAVAVAPDVYSVLHEDERARVLEMRLPAGAVDGEHTHPDEVVYFLAGGTVRVTTAEGAMELEIPDGYVLSHEGWTHTVENVGETDVHAIVWELR